MHTTPLLPYHPFGLGLRNRHYSYIMEHSPAVGWFEVISENFMDTDGKAKRNLLAVRERYPIAMHGVSLSIGTVDPCNSDYLRKLKQCIGWLNPLWVSDHLCWTGVAHKNTHDLLPLPYTEEALTHIIQRIKQVQDYLEQPIALENPSTYLTFNHSTLTEAAFIAQMVEESGCKLLLDINNVYVTCYNHQLNPQHYIDTLPLDAVMQVHLSGHSNKGSHIIDTHNSPVIDEVWNLYKYMVHKAGRTPYTMVEWDDNIPDFPVLYQEMEKARMAANAAESYVLPVMPNDAPHHTVRSDSLSDIQHIMQDAIMGGNIAKSTPDEWITAKVHFSPEQQLNVYINGYRYRLYDSIAEDYPVLRTYMGAASFEALLWAFIANNPPEHFNIARYPAKLPEFIAHYLPGDSVVHELCQLETSIAQLADARETEALTPTHIAGMTAERLLASRLYPRNALNLYHFSHDINSYYQSVMDDRLLELPVKTNCYLAVFRHEDIIWRMALAEKEYALLHRICSGMTVGEALEGIPESAAIQLSQWFSRWMHNGLLATPPTSRK